MKKLFNILACLVFVFLLTSVSFAKSENKSSVVTAKTYINCELMSQCSDARQAASNVAASALNACTGQGADTDGCTRANANAKAARENAAFICEVEAEKSPYVFVEVGVQAANHTPEKKDYRKT